MHSKLNNLLDQLSNYLAHRKGLIPFIGILLVLLNGLFQFIPNAGWLVNKNILLHLGIIIAVLGIMLAQAL